MNIHKNIDIMFATYKFYLFYRKLLIKQYE